MRPKSDQARMVRVKGVNMTMRDSFPQTVMTRVCAGVGGVGKAT